MEPGTRGGPDRIALRLAQIGRRAFRSMGSEGFQRVAESGPRAVVVRRTDQSLRVPGSPTVVPERSDTSERGTIRAGVTLADLITERGHQGDNLGAFVTGLLDEWHTEITPRVLAEMDNAQSQDEVTTLHPVSLSLNGADVELLGINHGIPSFLGGKFIDAPYAKEVKRFVNSSSEQGRRWLIEQGIDDAFGLQGQVESLTDTDRYYKELGLGDINEISMVNGFREDRKAYSAFTMHAGTGAERAISERLRKIEENNLGEINATHLEHKLVSLTKLPEPLDIEVGLALSFLYRDDEMNLMIDRSVMQAREFRGYITPGASLGLLIGQMHQSQVEYCLTHPDYDPHESVARAKKVLGVH